jgi:hypothetical protein
VTRAAHWLLNRAAPWRYAGSRVVADDVELEYTGALLRRVNGPARLAPMRDGHLVQVWSRRQRRLLGRWPVGPVERRLEAVFGDGEDPAARLAREA